MKKRMMSMILCLALALTMVPINVFASEVEATDEVAAGAETVIAEEVEEPETPEGIMPEETTAEVQEGTEESSEGETTERETDHLEEELEPVALSILDSGKCGKNVKWTLYSDGRLVLTGSGATYNRILNDDFESPFWEWEEDIHSIEIGNGITSIGAALFPELGFVDTVSIPSTVKSIGADAFAETSITAIDIPSSVTSIGEGAFAWSELESVSLHEGLQKIGDQAFEHCENLESIILPESVTSIGAEAFADCGKMKGIAIPRFVTYIGEHALGFTYRYVNGEKVWSAVDGFCVGGYKYSIVEAYALLHQFEFVDYSESSELPEINVTKNETVTGLYAGERFRIVSEGASGYACSNRSVAEVDSAGVLSARSEGTCKITISRPGRKSITLTVKVQDPSKVQSISLDTDQIIYMVVGAEYEVNALIVPANAETIVSWSSSAGKIATVKPSGNSHCTIKAQRKGSATITVKTANGKKATVRVRVYENKADYINPKPTQAYILDEYLFDWYMELKSVEIVTPHEVKVQYYFINGLNCKKFKLEDISIKITWNDKIIAYGFFPEKTVSCKKYSATVITFTIKDEDVDFTDVNLLSVWDFYKEGGMDAWEVEDSWWYR